MSPQEFQQALNKEGVNLSPQQLAQFQLYLDLLIQTNKVVNLTSITDPAEIYVKHFYDSAVALLVQPQLQQAVSLADIGSGAGFPGLVLKIINPQLQLTIVDSLQKRINFLEQVVQKLQLTNVQLIHARAEEFGRQKEYREHFDFVTARAVAKLPALLELCLPVVKLEGTFIALKSQQAQNELDQAQNALQVLGGQVTKLQQWQLPEQAGVRELILIQKIHKTPAKYPRKPGTPTKQPL